MKITICESRPKLEGRILAKKLIKEKIIVEIITEALAAQAIQKCDCILIGADAILKNFDVINKTGSLLIAILCMYYKRPFYVAADKSKFNKETGFIQRKEPASEVWENQPLKSSINNYYFEKINHVLISKFFSA